MRRLYGVLSDWSGFQTRIFQLKTLTVGGSPPIRPRFLEMDAILDPRAGRAMRLP